ncbi:MAG: TetR/AcrR family transcriptional regulator, partial [Hyphomicrobiales bacterium]|nr:TetR/AcrR family transcriptional regulator [Hyphomicrobiales bacterium]
MSWSKDDPGERDEPRGYHHGNLREALIRAALELIAKKGPAGFTFAEAARFAGVSPAAPYRHFRDRDELMANVALRGFEQFGAALARAWDEGRPDAFAALDRIGKAYLEFARAEPAFYSAMFEAGIPVGANPALREAADNAFSVLRNAAEKICAGTAGAGRPPALMVA